MMACSCSRRSSASRPDPVEPGRRLEQRAVEGASDHRRRLRDALWRRPPGRGAPRSPRRAWSAVRRATSEPSVSPRASSSRKSGTPSARRTSALATLRLEPLAAGQPLEHLRGLVVAQPVECQVASRLDLWVVGDLGSGAHHDEDAASPRGRSAAPLPACWGRPSAHPPRPTGGGAAPACVLDPGRRLLRRGRHVTHDLTEGLQRAQRATAAAEAA